MKSGKHDIRHCDDPKCTTGAIRGKCRRCGLDDVMASQPCDLADLESVLDDLRSIPRSIATALAWADRYNVRPQVTSLARSLAAALRASARGTDEALRAFEARTSPAARPRQSRLEAMLIMAYNAGREHAVTGAMTIDEGRAAIPKHLQAIFPDADIGDLAEPIAP